MDIVLNKASICVSISSMCLIIALIELMIC